LKIEGGEVAESENKNGGPVPENGVGKGCQRTKIGHLVGKNALITDGVGSAVEAFALSRDVEFRAPAFNIVAARVGRDGTGDSVVHVADTAVSNIIRVDVDYTPLKQKRILR
jgi:hypothetical protein